MPAVQSGWSIIKIKAEAKFCLHIFETALQLQEKNIFGLCSCSYAVAKISKEIIWWYWCHSFLVSHFQIIQVFNMKKYRWMKIWTFSDETNMTFFLVAHHWQKGFSVIKSRKKKKRRKTWFLLTTIKWSLKMHVFFFYGSFSSWHAASVCIRSFPPSCSVRSRRSTSPLCFYKWKWFGRVAPWGLR